ncbi:MAG: hypothetical protein MMC23_006536 [Stictis urceolatum]|nr:hypothetical protein [Stictis urceolata]
MSRVTPDAEAGDAAIAACYALMMQSWYMDDGLKSFLILSRSCSAVHGQVRESGVGAVFAQDDRMARVERMKKKFEGAPRFSETFLEHAIQSLEALRGLCEELFELDLIGRLEDCFRNLCNSPYQAYLHHIEIDEMITALAPEECQQLLDSSNEVCQLLLAHMIAMYLIMRPVSCRERTAYTATMYGIRMTSWIDHISECLSEEHKAYLTWPLLKKALNSGEGG